ncbi:MAG TPA: radical SAM family heme chaperone HemW [Ignavibacteriaceae bacterium]|nr:radical SAM family heme chaperone HemW [Ignavibacteriaceae bacterium]
MKQTACYIHIPFCDHKCIYCDFYSIITTDSVSSFLTSIKKEIEFYSKLYSSQREFISIYFGGGTPSLMEPDYIAEIINNVKENFLVRENAEITLETNPGTVSKSKLEEFRKKGINRLSVGIQSFNEEELKFLTRIHSAQTAIETIENAHIAGFENINADLIFNLPGQSKEKWLFNLEQAIKLPVKHVSAYSLILERGTILNKMVLDGKVKMQDDDYDADLYETTIDFFERRGFNQYEVSNFALPGYECVHNNAYWHYVDYLGFGTSAHSFVDALNGEGGKRWWNYSSAKMYIDAIQKKHNAEAGSEIISSVDKLTEFVMLALRSSGINLSEFEKRFGNGWIEKKYFYLQKLQSAEYIIMNDDQIRLTKRGYAICDEILKELL